MTAGQGTNPLRITRAQVLAHKEAARRRRRRAPDLTINLTPMIDVTFLLLIFFSVTTTFQRPEGFLPAQLPGNAGTAAVPIPVRPIVVRVEQYGLERGAYRLRIDNFVNTPATFGELAGVLQEIQTNPGFSTSTPVVIAAEPDVSWDHVVNCWNAAVRAGCQNIAFGGK